MFDLIPFGRNERNLFNYLDNVERSFWDGSISNMAQFRCDVQDKGDSYLLEAELPGFEREDIGIDLDGRKDVLGMWVGENESAKYWATVLNSLKNRGIEDIFIACTDI